MTDNFRRIEPPGISEFYTVSIPVVQVPEEELPIALIAPHYDVQDAFAEDGSAQEAAAVGTVTTNQIQWVYERVFGEKTSFPLEAVDAARRIADEDIRLFGTFGAGRQFALAATGEERILRRGTASIERSPSSPIMVLQDNAANFRRIVERAGLAMQTPDFRRPLLAIRLVEDGRGILLPVDLKLSEDFGNERALVVYADMAAGRMFAGESDTRRATNVSYELVLRPRTTEVVNARQHASTTIACVDYSDTIYIQLFRPFYITDGSRFRFIKMNSATLTLTFVSTDDSPSVTVAGNTITVDLGDAGPVSVASLNSLLLAETSGVVDKGYFDESFTDALLFSEITGSYYVPGFVETGWAEIHNIDPLTPAAIGVVPPGASFVPGAGTRVLTDNLFEITLPGRGGLVMGGVTAEDLVALALQAADYEQARIDQGMLTGPYRVRLSSNVQEDPSQWQILTPSGTAVSTFLDSINPIELPPARITALADLRYRTPGPVGNQFSVQIEDAIDNDIRIGDDGGLVIEYDGWNLNALAARLEGTPYEIINVRAVRQIGSGDTFEALVPIEDPADWPSDVVAIFPFLEDALVLGTGSTTAPVRALGSREAQLQGGSNRAAVKVSLDEFLSPAQGIPIRVLADYRALRLDTSAATSVTAFGRAPDFVPVTRENYQAIAGRPQLRNPLAMMLEQFFRVAPQSVVSVLSVSEVSATFPYGTPAAINEALELLVRRRPYFIGIPAHGSSVQETVAEWCRSLGGDLPSRLRKMANVFLPIKNPTDEPVIDLVTGTSTDVEQNDDDGTYFSVVQGTVDISDDIRLSEIMEAGRLVMVVTQFPTSTDAPILLADGRRGWRVSSAGINGNPFAFRVEGEGAAFAITAGDQEFELVDRGESLLTPSGSFRSSAAARAIAVAEPRTAHRFLCKVLGDTVTLASAGRTVTVPHEVGVIPQILGMIAISDRNRARSLTDNTFVAISRYTGTNDVYAQDDLNIVRGAGIIIPVQPNGPNTPVELSRDLTSDVTNRWTQKRSAQVLDHLLSLRVRRRVRPLLGPNDISSQFIDTVALAVNAELDALRDQFETLTLRTIRPITDADRARYQVNDTGVYVALERKHREEAAAMILENFII